MLENVIDIIKSTVTNAISGNESVPEEKKVQTVETTTNALTDGLKRNINLGNMTNIISLFKGSNSSASNPITGNIQTSVVNALVQKVGLSQGVANMISSTVVPMVMSALSGKINDPDEKGFDIQSLIHSFSGSTTTAKEQNEKTNILSGIKSIFE